MRWAWMHLKQRHRDAPRFAVIAYGKLGGKELGYGSDLDVVFLYDDPTSRRRAAEVYGAFVRKLITWLTLRTAAGELFDIDTALRPNGNSGLLVTSMTLVRALPDGPRQQHRVDLGAPGHHAARASAPAPPRIGAALRGGAARRDGRAARPRRRCATKSQAMREKVRAAHPVQGRASSTSSTAPAA